jgi:hypothetical protein
MLVMIHPALNTRERRQIRHSFAKLAKLLTTVRASRIKMENVGLQIKDKYLKRSILTFVTETAPCEDNIQRQMDSLSHVFPLQDLHTPEKDRNDDISFNCPFQCAMHYEKEVVSAFRSVLNDGEVLSEIRNTMQSQLNEILYSYLKIKLLNSFSLKEISRKDDIF